MDAPISNDEDSSNMYELLSNEICQDPDKELINESLSKEVEYTLKVCRLGGRSIAHVFGLGGKRTFSLEEIGDHFELTRERKLDKLKKKR